MDERTFRKTLVAKCPSINFWPVENKSDSGMPDLHYMVENSCATGWVELKIAGSFEQKLSLRPAQVVWIEDYIKRGGNCLIVVLVKQWFVAVYDGSKVRELQEKKLGEVAHMAMSEKWRGFGEVIDALEHTAFGSPEGVAAMRRNTA